MGEEKSCKTCSFAQIFPTWMESTEHEPCLSCNKYSNWRSKI